MKEMKYVNMFNQGIRRVQDMLFENGNKEAVFDVSKLTAFEVTVPSTVDVTQDDTQGDTQDDTQGDTQGNALDMVQKHEKIDKDIASRLRKLHLCLMCSPKNKR